MKRNWIVAFGILASAPAALASSPEELVASFPKVPSSGCVVEPGEKAAYAEKVRAAAARVREELDRRNADAKQGVASQESTLRANALASAGMSPEQAASMQAAAEQSGKTKDPEARKAQQKKMADAYLQGKMNMSLEEVEKLKKMSKEGKAEWAKAYMAEQQAVNDDPAKVKADAQRQVDDAKGTKNATDQQQVLLKTLQAGPARIGQQLQQNETRDEATKALRELNAMRSDRQARMSSGKGLEGLPQLEKKIRQAEVAYCKMLSPTQLRLIGEYRSLVVDSMPKYRELDKANAEAMSAQYGLKPAASNDGKSGLEALQALASVLGKAYEYDPGIKPEQ